MKREDIHILCSILGEGRVKDNNDWVQIPCPFAEYNHENGNDSKPSFGISISAPSYYNCFSCGVSSVLSYLPTALSFYTKESYPELREFVIRYDDYEYKEYDDYSSHKKIGAIPESVLERFSAIPDKVIESIFIKRETAIKHELLWDANNQRMVFTVRDEFGRLVTLRSRYMGEDKNILKHCAYNELHPDGHDAKSFGVWYGMNNPLVPKKKLVIVEGAKDRVLLKQAGISNVWASLGSMLSKRQLITLKSVTNPVLLFTDNDKAGRISAEKMANALKKLTTVYKVTNYYGLNDPADLIINKRIKKALKSIKLYST